LQPCDKLSSSKKDIKMSDQNGKWLRYNQDGSQHDCKKNGKEATLETVQKKLASLGIIINLERLMKQ
jgi:hypothetical protein